MAGYSATPLSKKLGYKAGFRACVKGAPDHYFKIVQPLPDDSRSIALPLGLVDVKVCAVDDVWSGLKLVIRKELRK
jgi:hypothetical protein